MKYKIGDICIAYEGEKKRPVVIINNGLGIDIDVSIARVTSQLPRNQFDVPLVKWKESGLQKPSVVRCSKINTISPGQELLKIGHISDEDLKAVREAVTQYILQGFDSLDR
ncbi:MAG: type II toxin-antitoxin system PemK/MazF family toxin [Turicibacter sp.]|nr:type II toxin-antitoxin system PemK/MazF family toxin [Turicibacter sp.]